MIKIAVFEDNDLLRDSLAHMLHSIENMQCVGAWENASQIIKIVKLYNPDIIIMDIDMPITNGIEGLKILKANHPEIPVLMLTVFEDDTNVFNSICLGAKGYLLKQTAPEKIVESIHEIIEGGSPMSPSIARKVIQAFSLTQTLKNQDYQLTTRESDILLSLVDGNSYKMIGNVLGISINTVRQYIRRIYEKLEVHSMNEAVAKAIKEKIV